MQRKDDAEREQIKEMEKAEMKDAEMKGAEMEVEAKKQRWKKI